LSVRDSEQSRVNAKQATAMGPLAIVCGGGAFPAAVADAVRRRGREVILFALRGFADAASIQQYPHQWIYLGAIGDPRVEVGLVERAVIAGIRFGLDLYVNLRPIKLLAGHLCPIKDKKPEDIDMVVELGSALVNPNAYVLPFEVASVLLLAALIGAVVVAGERKS